MNRYDQISSIVWFFFALYICIESIRLPLGSLRDPGPGLLPLGTGIMLGLLSAVNYLHSRLSRSKEITETWYSKERWRTLIFVIASLLAYAIFLEIFGFLISTFFILIFLFRCMQPMRWFLAVGGSALISFASYTIFELWLKAQLPKGILGF